MPGSMLEAIFWGCGVKLEREERKGRIAEKSKSKNYEVKWKLKELFIDGWKIDYGLKSGSFGLRPAKDRLSRLRGAGNPEPTFSRKLVGYYP